MHYRKRFASIDFQTPRVWGGGRAVITEVPAEISDPTSVGRGDIVYAPALYVLVSDPTSVGRGALNTKVVVK
jgi:hypothetical protein